MENIKQSQERANIIIEEIKKHRESRPKVSMYIYPCLVSPNVCEILTKEGYMVQLKKNDITRQFVTEITW